MKLKKILIICPFFRPNIGGVESHLHLLTKYLSEHNYKTTVLTYKPITTKVDNYLKLEKTKNLTIHRYWWFGQKLFDKSTPFPLLQFIYVIPGLLISSYIYITKNKKNIDVIHAHGFAAAFITRVCCLFNKNIKLVVSTHYLYPNLDISKISTKLLKWTFIGFDTILTVSSQSSLQLENLGINKQKIKQYHHWLDPKIYKSSSLKTKSKYSLNLLFVGRIITMKGVFNLLRVAQRLPNIMFTIIGDGPDYIRLKKESIDQKNFLLLGKKNPQEIIKYYQQNDFTILPSLAPEAQPMTVMESLMCGTPVITTNKGSVTNMYTSDVGISINPTNEILYKTLYSLSQTPDNITKLKSNCRSFALKNFGTQNANIITKSYNHD